MSKNYMQTDQMAHMAALSQISTTPPSDGREIADIFTNINKRVTDPLSLSVAGLVLTVGNTIVESGPDGKKRGLPQLDAVDLGDLTGSFDFAAGPGGAITATGDCQATTSPAVATDYYMRVGVEVRSDRKIYLVFGTPAVSVATAGAPAFSEGVVQIGELLLQEDGAGGFISHTDQSGITQFGTGSGGGGSGSGLGNINYVINFKGDIDANNWVTYNDGGAVPVDGIGGTVDGGFTFTKTDVDPLRGKGSLLITKPASDVFGHGVSTPLKTIDLADRGRVLEVTFDYEITGTYAGDFGVWLYNMSVPSLITPYGSNIIPYGKGRARMQFLCPANAEEVRLIIHNRTTSAQALTIKLDLVSVGPIFETEAIKKLVTQSSPHLLATKDIVWFTGSTWAKADASVADFKEDYQIGMVLEVIDSYNFVLLLKGHFRWPTGAGLNPGQVYFLSETAGGYTASTDREVVVPLFQALGQFEGWFDPQPPRKLDVDPVIPFSLLRHGFLADVLLRGGELFLDSGETLVSGNGTTEATVGSNLTINFDIIIGGSPSNNTTYYLYIDRYSLSEVTLTDSGRKVLQAYSNNHFKLLLTPPDQTNPFRYIYLGLYHTADTGNSWSGTGSAHAGVPTKRHLTTYSLLTIPQKKRLVFTSAVNALYAHGLEGKPHIINAFYDDGTDNLIDATNVITSRTDTQLGINTSAYTFGSGEELVVEAVYFPELGKNLASVSGRVDSGWITSSVASIAHNLSDALDITGVSVMEHNTSTGRYRLLVGSGSPVVNHDGTNIYLDWTGFSFSNLRYRVFTAGSPVPQALPTYIGGYTKFVGNGPGSYGTLTAALADAQAGDNILVFLSESLTAPIDVSVGDIRICFMPNVKFTFTSGSKGMILSGDNIRLENPWVVMNIAGAAASGIEVSGDENWVDGRVEAANGSLTLSAAFAVTSSGARNWINGVVRTTSGTVTAPFDDQGTDTGGNVRG